MMAGRHSSFNRLRTILLMIGVSLCVPISALAADASGNWRQTYDTIMMWVNFLILAGLLVKFLRHPLRKFLKEQRDTVKDTLAKLEDEKTRVQDEIQSFRRLLEDRKQKATDLYQRIVDLGESERREVIEAAQREAERRLVKARQLIDARHREACHTLRNEMIDMAVRMAMEELPKHMAPDLEQALTNRFLQSISDPS